MGVADWTGVKTSLSSKNFDDCYERKDYVHVSIQTTVIILISCKCTCTKLHVHVYVVVQNLFWFKNFQTSLIFISLCLRLWPVMNTAHRKIIRIKLV